VEKIISNWILMNLNSTVRNEITIGVLIGGLCVAVILWFLVYTQEKLDTFASFTTYPGVEIGR